MNHFATNKFNNPDELISLVKLILKPEFEKTSHEILERNIFTPGHLKVIQHLVCWKTLLSFIGTNLAPSMCHLTLFMNERNFTLKDVINVMGSDPKIITTFLNTYVNAITNSSNLLSAEDLNTNLQEAEQDLSDYSITSEFIQIIKAILLTDKYLIDQITDLESLVKNHDLSPSELNLYYHFYKNFPDSSEDIIASIKKYKITLEQAESLQNEIIKNHVKNISDFENILKSMSNTTKSLDQNHYNYLKLEIAPEVIKYQGIAKILEMFTKYDLTEDQFKILDQKFLYCFAVLDFDKFLSLVSKHPLSDNQIKILYTLTIKYPIYEELIVKKTTSFLNFEGILKTLSKAPYLSEDQIDLLNTVSFAILAVKKAISLDEILFCVSQHHLNDEQLGVLRQIDHSLSNLKNASQLETYLSNIEKYNQPNQPWRAWFKEKLGYGGKIEKVESKISIPVSKIEYSESKVSSAELINVKITPELVETIAPLEQE